MECGLTLLHLQPVSIHEFYLFSRQDHFGRVRSIFANLDLDENYYYSTGQRKVVNSGDD